MDKVERIGSYLITGLLGFGGGVVLDSFIGARLNSLIPYNHEDLPKVMKADIYREKDLIAVEDSENPGNYIELSDHLKRIEDPFDRTIERAKIERLVSEEE